MKARLLVFAVAAVMTAFTACTNEKIIYVEKEDVIDNIQLEPGEGIIRISTSNTISRTARPITSNKATNNVDRIMFKFVNNSDNREFTGFNVEGIVEGDGELIENTSSDDNILVIPDDVDLSQDTYVRFSGLVKGNYKIYAFGYSSKVAEDGSFPFVLNYDSTDKVYKCSLPEGKTEIDELFVGVLNEKNDGQNAAVNASGLFTQSNLKITLRRQVAALMAYMSNVPVFVNNDKGEPHKVTKITISCPKKMQGIYVPGAFISSSGSSQFNGYGDSYNEDETKFDHLLTFDLTDATHIDLDSYDKADYGDTYEFEEDVNDSQWDDDTYLLAKENVGYDFKFTDKFKPQNHTLFGSRFIYAYGGTYSPSDDENLGKITSGTLNICYWGKETDSGNEFLIKRVRLMSNDNKNFQLEYNHFYAVGHLSEWYDDNGSGTSTGTDSPLDIMEPSGADGFPVNIVDEYDGTHDLQNKNTSSSTEQSE